MTALATSRHYDEVGDYWPVNGRGKGGHAQRYGVLMLQGYSSRQQWITSFHVCDLALNSEVVATYRVRGRPGSQAVQRQRVVACEDADDRNFTDREYERSA